MQNRWIHSGVVIAESKRETTRFGEKQAGARLEVDATSTPSLSLSPACQERMCSKGYTCAPYAQKCESIKDCKAESCCVVLDLDIIDSNIPGRSLPEAFIAPCGDTGDIFCDKVCGRTEPDWSDF
jgi:hypothetical protein